MRRRFNLVSHLVEWLRLGEMSQAETELVHHLWRWIKANLHGFTMVSEIIASLLSEPEDLLAKRAYLDFQDRSFTIPRELHKLGS